MAKVERMLVFLVICCACVLTPVASVTLPTVQYSKETVNDVASLGLAFHVVARSSKFGVRAPNSRIRCAGACSKMTGCRGYFLLEKKCVFGLTEAVPEFGDCDVIIPDGSTPFFVRPKGTFAIPGSSIKLSPYFQQGVFANVTKMN